MIERSDKHKRVAPATVRYIKLGPGGAWEAASLGGGRIDWGNQSDPLAIAAAEVGDWDRARRAYLDAGVLPATASSYLRELKDFYSLGSDCLWITFARGHLWWAFAEPEVFRTSEPGPSGGECYRKVIDGWRKTDVEGKPLTIVGLSSKLTQLAGYRRTICNVAEADYLLRRINAEEEPVVAAARAARQELVHATEGLIRQLHWDDFETFVDLIFSRAGWRRVSRLGGRMKDIDLMLEQPLTGERASVQVKSAADQSVLNACVSAFEANTSASRFFFVCHSPRSALSATTSGNRPVDVWTIEQLASAAVDQGLTDWLIERAD
jgi:hypothetical protein